jgi:hypothetical protein
MKAQKLTRRSLAGVEYQIEYIPVPDSPKGEYRVRRGVHGGWSNWYSTDELNRTLGNLGFLPSAISDFAFEALFGRGEIILDKRVVHKLASTTGTNNLSKFIYSRLKAGKDIETWILPAHIVADRSVFYYLLKLYTSDL